MFISSCKISAFHFKFVKSFCKMTKTIPCFKCRYLQSIHSSCRLHAYSIRRRCNWRGNFQRDRKPWPLRGTSNALPGNSICTLLVDRGKSRTEWQCCCLDCEHIRICTWVLRRRREPKRDRPELRLTAFFFFCSTLTLFEEIWKKEG